ncbi:hypothetical protein G9A89_006248 [Geosiphon pyriformis]|nr:hypothetical protein G9A89_006248 [Geosiphon pyriformis]
MDVSAQLKAQANKYKPITVEKPVPLEFDLGLLAAFDTNALDDTKLKTNTDDYLKEYNRDAVQLLFNEIFKLPVLVQDASVFVELPEVKTILPREKRLPKAKPPTRWEKFAKTKGIQKQKKSKMIFNEATGEWVSRWGYKGVNDDGANDWLIPVSANDDPFQDQFAKRREAKKQRVSKNEARHQRNLDETAAKDKNSSATAILDPKSTRKAELYKEIAISKTATASIGKFDKPLEGEPKIKGIKRKFEPTIVVDLKQEKEKSLNILKKVVSKTGGSNVLNIRKAIAKTKKS